MQIFKFYEIMIRIFDRLIALVQKINRDQILDKS